VGSIKLVKRSPFISIVTLAVLAVRIAAIVVFMIIFISFIVNNGYQRQLGYISSFDLNRAIEMDSVQQFVTSLVLLYCIFPLTVSFIAIIIALINKERKRNKAVNKIMVQHCFFANFRVADVDVAFA
jgi:hypothetical protein